MKQLVLGQVHSAAYVFHIKTTMPCSKKMVDIQYYSKVEGVAMKAPMI